MPLDDGRGGTIPALERGRDMLETIPSAACRAAERYTLDNRLKPGGHSNTARQVELAP
jgi:hypothetical protein